jgi:hypothetical protein
MPQLTYTDASPEAGRGVRIIRPGSVRNLRTAQVVNWDVNSGTTDGSYVLTLKTPNGVDTLATATFVASSNTAAQIAAGMRDAIKADPTFRGFITAVAVVNTDQIDIDMVLQQHDLNYVVEYSGPSGPTQPTDATDAGYTRIASGIILQSDGSGSFTTTYSDGSLALGVTYFGPTMEQPDDYSETASSRAPEVDIIREGEMPVRIATGVTVNEGDKVYFNSTTKRWSNSSSGSHVVVKGAQWRTSGTTVQSIYFNLPAES